jgi:hypothetical protein
MDYPNDDDGDALRRVALTSDMTKPMVVDFAVDVPTEAAGEKIAALAAGRGYSADVELDDESQRWTCYCTKTMVATYAAMIAAQEELDELSAPFGGKSDGWGTAGNGRPPA